jgi:hypothetical protein
MGEGTGDGAADDTRDGPADDSDALGASTDNARDEGVDDDGDVDERDGVSWNPKPKRVV